MLCDIAGAVIEARDIVDGHREKTLQLLWALVFHFQVGTHSVFSGARGVGALVVGRCFSSSIDALDIFNGL